MQEQLGALRDQLAGVEAQAHSLSQQVAVQQQEMEAKQASMEQVWMRRARTQAGRVKGIMRMHVSRSGQVSHAHAALQAGSVAQRALASAFPQAANKPRVPALQLRAKEAPRAVPVQEAPRAVPVHCDLNVWADGMSL